MDSRHLSIHCKHRSNFMREGYNWGRGGEKGVVIGMDSSVEIYSFFLGCGGC